MYILSADVFDGALSHVLYFGPFTYYFIKNEVEVGLSIAFDSDIIKKKSSVTIYFLKSLVMKVMDRVQPSGNRSRKRNGNGNTSKTHSRRLLCRLCHSCSVSLFRLIPAMLVS